MYSRRISDFVDCARSQYLLKASRSSGSTLILISASLRRGLSGTLHLNCCGGTILARIRFAPKMAKHLLPEVSLTVNLIIFELFSAPFFYEYTR